MERIHRLNVHGVVQWKDKPSNTKYVQPANKPSIAQWIAKENTGKTVTKKNAGISENNLIKEIRNDKFNT